MDIVIPSLTDPSMAPPGQARDVVLRPVRAVRPRTAAGTTPKREAFGDAVIDTIERVRAEPRDCILHRQVLTPWDLERIAGLTEGNIFHGELLLEQLFFLRPRAAGPTTGRRCRATTSCASGTHPGGGVMGAAGKLAAEAILKDRA